jgi:hypothetical protein
VHSAERSSIEHSLLNIIFDLALFGSVDLRARLTEVISKYGPLKEHASKFEELTPPNESELSLVQKAKAMYIVFLLEGNKTPGQFIVTIDLRKENWHLDVDPQIERIKALSRKAAAKLSHSPTTFSPRGNCQAPRQPSRVRPIPCRRKEDFQVDEEELPNKIKSRNNGRKRKNAQGLDSGRWAKKIILDDGEIDDDTDSEKNDRLHQCDLSTYHKCPDMWEKVDSVGETEYSVRSLNIA